MDPVRFRKRQLFRPQALANFVGALGDGNMPELLFSWPKKLGVVVLILIVLSALTWAGTANLPVRVTLRGDVEQGTGTLVCFWAKGIGRPLQHLQSGQRAYLFVGPDNLKTVHLTTSAQNAACAQRNGTLTITLDALEEASFKHKDVTLAVNVGRQGLWSFLWGDEE